MGFPAAQLAVWLQTRLLSLRIRGSRWAQVLAQVVLQIALVEGPAKKGPERVDHLIEAVRRKTTPFGLVHAPLQVHLVRRQHFGRQVGELRQALPGAKIEKSADPAAVQADRGERAALLAKIIEIGLLQLS